MSIAKAKAKAITITSHNKSSLNLKRKYVLFRYFIAHFQYFFVQKLHELSFIYCE